MSFFFSNDSVFFISDFLEYRKKVPPPPKKKKKKKLLIISPFLKNILE